MNQHRIKSILIFLSLAVTSVSPLSALAREPGDVLAIVGGKVCPAPAIPPIADGVVLIADGKILKLGPRRKVRVPANAKIIDATGLVLVAGYWNCHVHFTESQWQDAAHQPVDKLSAQLQRMITSYGFTTVFDIASVLANTNALRRRVDSGEISGPKIFTTGEPLFPKNGVPIYVKTVISPELFIYLQRVAEVEAPGPAQAFVDQRIGAGADAIKIFTGSWVGDGNTIDMPLEIVQTATVETHRLGKLVFAHPQTRGGLENACTGGVDIIAHTAPTAGVWDAALLARMKMAQVSLIPTLKLWHVEAIRGRESPANTEEFIQAGVEQLRAFAGTGGRVLFGTDVGYIDDYDTSEEFELMARAGMNFQDILASLTTAPVARFGQSDHQGRIAPGFDADLVLLQGDPALDVRAFAEVKYTIRAGKIIYDRSQPARLH